jgi:hypothetical protein
MLSACEMQGKIEKEGFDWIYPWFDKLFGEDEERTQHGKRVPELIDLSYQYNQNGLAWSFTPNVFQQTKFAGCLHDIHKEIGVPLDIRSKALNKNEKDRWYAGHGLKMAMWLQEHVSGFKETFPVTMFLIANHNGYPEMHLNGYEAQWNDRNYIDPLYLMTSSDSVIAAHEPNRPFRTQDNGLTAIERMAKGWHFIYEITGYIPPILEDEDYLRFLAQTARDIIEKVQAEPARGVEAKT